MKIIKLCALLALTTGLLGSGLAMADHGHGGGGHWHSNIGLYIGPGFGPYYPRYYGDPFYYGYPPPYYYGYPPAVVVTPQQPPVYYIEQGQQQPQAIGPQVDSSQSAPQQDNFWYHCDKPEGYYPYIKDCPQGWQKVVPEPPRR